MVTVAAEATLLLLALLSRVTSANTAVAGWIYQELHGKCGAAYPRQVVVDQWRRRGRNDAPHVRKGQRQRGGHVAFDVPRRRLHRRQSVGSSFRATVFPAQNQTLLFACVSHEAQVGGQGACSLRFSRFQSIRQCHSDGHPVVAAYLCPS